jgi:RNA polymerase sigma-70 factor (ECF subfamily)
MTLPSRRDTLAAVDGEPSATYESSREDQVLLQRLLAGDEAAFMHLVDRYGMQMLRVAQMYVSTRAAAEEVVQETWLAVLSGLDRFESRASLKTWIFRILTNRAKTRGIRERRVVPFSSLADASEDDGPTVEPERFEPRGARWEGHWSSYPTRWSDLPEERLLANELMEIAQRTIDTLPPNQRTVITLRDIDGWDSHEVCELLDITEINQRVLLHRARAKVRSALERELHG